MLMHVRNIIEYVSIGSSVLLHSSFGLSRFPVHLSVQCNGSELRLEDCTSVALSNASASCVQGDINIKCSG